MRLRRTRTPALSAAEPQQLMTDLLSTVRAAHPGVDTGPIERAYTVVARLHHGQRRESGDPYITHPIAVAATVAEMGMSSETVCAALLHDSIEDTDYSPAQLREDFGEVVACLIEGVTRLDKIQIGADGQAQNLRDRVLAISDDPRVFVLKLADRLHNLRTIRFLPSALQALKARETLEVFAPLARQLGIATTINRELEDLATNVLYPGLCDQRYRTAAERALTASVLLLPSAHRARWVEEWTGELSVLPTRRARARFALHMLRGIPHLALALRQPVTCDAHRPVSTIVEKLAGILGVIGAFLMALIRWELAAWTVAAMVLGSLILLSAVLFARSDAPANRLRALVRAWRDPVSTARSSRDVRDRSDPSEPEARRE
jgi:HD domain